MNYIVITPARNEEDNLPMTIESMEAQTLKPACWVIVNDGSSDRTGQIADEVAQRHHWIKVVHRRDRGYAKQGGGIIAAFYSGLECVDHIDWSFLVKFDADLSFSKDYFEDCLNEFKADPELGIGGGVICRELNGTLQCEAPRDPAFHVRGATKIYRRACWEAIDGLIRAPGWDGVDELKANMLGWETRSFPGITLKHHRPTGQVDGSWKNLVKFGKANYIAGYHPLFMMLKCVRRSLNRPYLLAGAGIGWGYLKSYFSRETKVVDKRLVSYVRGQQMRRIFKQQSLWSDTIANRMSS